MADEASFKSRDEILRKILHEIEEWQWSYDDQTLFVKIHSEKYLISCEVLDRVFSGIGGLESIKKLYHGSQLHSLIRFQNRDSVIRAFECYDGSCIYDGCCRMELFPGGRKKSRWNGAETPIEDASQPEDFKKLDSSQEFSQTELEDSKLDPKTSVGEPDRELGIQKDPMAMSNGNLGQRTAVGDQPVKNQAPSDLNQESGKGISVGSLSRGNIRFPKLEFRLMDASCFSEDTSSDDAHTVMSELMANSFDTIDIGMNNFRKIPVSSPFENFSAYQVFDKMSMRSVKRSESSIQVNRAPLFVGNWVMHQHVFDPGITECQSYMYDGSSKQVVEQASLKRKECGLNFVIGSHHNWLKLVPSCECDSCKHGRFIFELLHAEIIVTTSHELDAVIWVYDRGKVNCVSIDVGFNQVKVEIKTVQLLLVQFHEPWRLPYAILQAVIMDGCWVLDGFVVFDPGGVHAWLATKLLNSVALVAVNSFPFDRGKTEVRYGIHLVDFIEPIWMEEMMTIFENGELFMMLPVYITKLPCLSEDQETNWKGFDVTMRAEIVKQRLQWDPGGLPNVLCLNIVGKEH